MPQVRYTVPDDLYRGLEAYAAIPRADIMNACVALLIPPGMDQTERDARFLAVAQGRVEISILSLEDFQARKKAAEEAREAEAEERKGRLRALISAGAAKAREELRLKEEEASTRLASDQSKIVHTTQALPRASAAELAALAEFKDEPLPEVTDKHTGRIMDDVPLSVSHVKTLADGTRYVEDRGETWNQAEDRRVREFAAQGNVYHPHYKD